MGKDVASSAMNGLLLVQDAVDNQVGAVAFDDLAGIRVADDVAQVSAEELGRVAAEVGRAAVILAAANDANPAARALVQLRRERGHDPAHFLPGRGTGHAYWWAKETRHYLR
jgi:hypothetical protein